VAAEAPATTTRPAAAVGVAASPPPTAAPAGPTPATPPAPAVAPPVPIAPATPAPSASLVLRASQGFCSPSMDDQPASIHPSYEHVISGVHRIYCTLPGQPRTFVADYDLRAGGRANLVIIPAPDGKPTLSRPD
jgi:hypothetical protein